MLNRGSLLFLLPPGSKEPHLGRIDEMVSLDYKTTRNRKFVVTEDVSWFEKRLPRKLASYEVVGRLTFERTGSASPVDADGRSSGSLEKETAQITESKL